MARTRIRKQNTKKTKLKAICLVGSILLLFLLFFSVVFSLLNIGNNKIAKGVKIGKVDVSNLTQEEATKKLDKWYKEVALSNLSAIYQELEETITIEQFDSTIDIDKAVKEACLVGKSGNIIKDNYNILYSMLFSKKIEAPIQLNQEEIDKKIEEINAKIPGALEESNYYIEEDKLIIIKGKSGVQIEKEKFNQELRETMIKEENRTFKIPVKELSPKEIKISDIHKEIYSLVKKKK